MAILCGPTNPHALGTAMIPVGSNTLTVAPVLAEALGQPLRVLAQLAGP
jgi:hypothetical protein